MKKLITSYILLAGFLTSTAQDNTPEPPKPQKYVAVVEEEPRLVFFQGFTLSADLFGPVQYLVSDYGSFEGALRLNLKNTFFPVVELGFALCDTEDANTLIRYTTQAPYMRIGVDVNLLKDKFQDNKLYIGARYGLSRYEFDISGPPLTDPVWGGSEPFSYKGIGTTSHWFELVAGVQVKVWSNIHMGWSVRYKHEISSTKNAYAKPYFIPGYGTTTHTTSWGATYTLNFDLNWGKKKKAKVHQVTIIEQPVIPAVSQPTDSIH